MFEVAQKRKVLSYQLSYWQPWDI